MAYPSEIHEQAFIRFSQRKSFDEIAVELRSEFPDVCPKLRRQTVQKWADVEGWRVRREAIESKVAKATDNKIVSARLEMVEQLRSVRERLAEQVKSLTAKSLEGAIHALNSTMKLELELTGERAKIGAQMNIEKMMVVMFEVLSEDPKLGKVLSQRQDFILKRISEKLLTE